MSSQDIAPGTPRSGTPLEPRRDSTFRPVTGACPPVFIAPNRHRRIASTSDTKTLEGASAWPYESRANIKPWRDANDAERLDGSNGLLLSPHIDHLFDEGYITFSSRQELVIVPGLGADRGSPVGTTETDLDSPQACAISQ